jgi:hypothetical protein
VDQIWVQPNGRVQVLDAPLHLPTSIDTSPTETNDELSLRVLREAAQVALEGQARPQCEATSPIQAPVPEHAGEILRRLGGGPDAYEAVAELQSDLTATHDRLAEVNWMLRGVHLIILALALALPLLPLFGFTLLAISPELAGPDKPPEAEIIFLMTGSGLSLIPAAWPVWAFLFRGGFTLPVMGLTLVRWDGRRAGRFRCAWRAFVVWTPLMLLLFLALAVKVVNVQATIIPLALWSLSVVYLAGCVALALWFPTRSLHDRLAGTYLVPR